MGALLDAVSHGLRALPQVRRDRLPRMADFALWAIQASFTRHLRSRWSSRTGSSTRTGRSFTQPATSTD
jgi:hypothetical protein